MCAKGASGLDDLHSATNEFLGHFVDVVYEYRGDGEELILNTIVSFLILSLLFLLLLLLL